MPRTHGYGPRGKRRFGKRDWNAKGRANVIGAPIGSTLPTVTLFSCNSDSDVFHARTRAIRSPSSPTAAVIVMDNAAFHKRADTKAAIEKAGHRLEYLPPYSPDLNPIEHKWAQAKAIGRKTAKTTEQIFQSELYG